MGSLRTLAAGATAAAVAVVGGCGSDDTKTVTDTAPTAGAQTTPATTPATGGSSAASGSSGAGALAKLTPPAGASQVSTSQKGGVAYSRYSTDATPSAVIADYTTELQGDGWTVVQSGGSGGGWGPYGGSGSGLTAKQGANYFDVQAGGEKGGTTWFEVCAGPGARAVCDELSNDASTGSGASQSGNDTTTTTSKPS